MNVHQFVQRNLHKTSGIVRIPVAASIFALAALILLPSSISRTGSAYAQNTNATIRGEVVDPTGALVPGAQVTVVNKDTGVTVFNGKTDSAGTFDAPQVIPGPYKITVASPGLKESVFDN